MDDLAGTVAPAREAFAVPTAALEPLAAGTSLGFGNTPRIVMLPVVELTWLLTKLIVALCGKPSSFCSPSRTARSPSAGTVILPSAIALRICNKVGSSMSK